MRIPTQGIIPLLVGGFFLQLDRKIDDGDVDGRDSESHASELAFHVRDHLRHSLGRSSGGGDDVAGAR